MKLETEIIKRSNNQSAEVNPISAPIHLTTTFLRNEDGSFTNDYRYARLDNPNRRELENSLCLLENGEIAYTFSSGMAAIQALFQSLSQGDHILLPDDVFFNVRMLLDEVYSRWGLRYTSVNMRNVNQIKNCIQENTKLIWIETPSNPTLGITDIQALVEIANHQDVKICVDNTWATPVLQNPLNLGADIVMHSSTKYFGGHSDVTGGCLIFKTKSALSEKLANVQIHSGAVPSPFDCWLIQRGLKTLVLRVKNQSFAAQKLAHYLIKHPMVEDIFYPGLETHPQHEIARAQMTQGFGTMLSVLIRGDNKTAFNISNRLKLFSKATSLGGVESLIEHRKSVEGKDSKTPDNLLRISVGLENIDDLISDWAQALKE